MSRTAVVLLGLTVPIVAGIVEAQSGSGIFRRVCGRQKSESRRDHSGRLVGAAAGIEDDSRH